MTESEEMYLLSIARLIEDGADRPVPLAQLAEAMEIAPVSANQMIRKLGEAGLVTYIPYKGADLTLEGQHRALQVLRRRRLWEVFLVERLQISPSGAESIVCRLEHIIPEEAAERLASFLGYPAFSPQGKPIPESQSAGPVQPGIALTQLRTNHEGQIVRIETDEAARSFLASQGIQPGGKVAVLACGQGGDLLVETEPGGRVSLAEALASQIWVEETSCVTRSSNKSHF